MKERRVAQSLLVLLLMITIFIPLHTKAASSYDYLDSIKRSSYGQYTGNMGDSFVYKIGKHEYTRGNTDINGKSYSRGLEVWIARWNYEDEISWAYATYNIKNKYKNLTGKAVLIDSYNTNNFDTTLYFYGDGKLIKQYHMTPSSFPFNFNVNLVGVKKLKVYAKDNTAVSGGTSFGLTGCKLSKSNPPKKPTISKVVKKTGKIVGKTTKNVTVYVKIGKKTYSGKSNKNGKFSINTKKKIKNGTEIKVWAKNKYGQTSSKKTLVVY